MEFLRRITANGQRPAWALTLDVASFFPSIHKQTLYGIIARHVRDPEWLWLTQVILFHDPTADYRFRSLDRSRSGPATDGYPIPTHKSLFGRRNERGLPIGNLTSQFWGNVYLNELDQFVKRRLRCRCYVRYVDDMVLLSEDRAQLLRWREAIAEFLQTRLRLALRADGQEPLLVRRGIDFVGWKAWWNYRVPRRRTVSRMRSAVETFERRRVRRAFGGLAQRLELSTDRRGAGGVPTVTHLRESLASYAGHLQHGAAWGAWCRTWAAHPWLDLLFRRDGWTFAPRWPQRHRARRFRDRYAQATRNAGDDCLVFYRVGCFIEFYGPQRLLAQRVLGLRRIYLPRAGYGFAAGFPRVAGGVVRSARPVPGGRGRGAVTREPGWKGHRVAARGNCRHRLMYRSTNRIARSSIAPAYSSSAAKRRGRPCRTTVVRLGPSSCFVGVAVAVMGPMGLVHVDMDVCRDGGPRHTVEFLIDSGATYSVLPWRVWRALGLKPTRTMKFRLADGRPVRRRLSDCRFRYEGIDVPSPVVLGERHDVALLGTVTLESMGLVLHPFDRTLKPMRMMLA